MPTRIVRDGILTSERIASLGWPAEVFYRRLMSVVDDYGRYYAHPSLLRAACYPLHLDKVSDSDIGKWLTACVNAALVRVYPASDGKRYLEILDFGQRVQSKSKFPAYSSDSQSSTVNHGEPPECTALVVVEVEDEVGSTRERKRALTLTRWLAELPDGEDAIPADHHVFSYADKVGIPREFLALAWQWMLDTYGENGSRKAKKQADWPKTFRNAVEGNWAKVWWIDPHGEYRLTTAGEQLRRAA